MYYTPFKVASCQWEHKAVPWLSWLSTRTSEICVIGPVSVSPIGVGRLPFWVILINKSAFPKKGRLRACQCRGPRLRVTVRAHVDPSEQSSVGPDPP